MYRGACLTKQQLEEYIRLNFLKKKIRLKGFTSTSLNREFALRTTLDESKLQAHSKIPVLYTIKWANKSSYQILDHSPFHHEEKEVLLVDNFSFKVIDVKHCQS